MVIDLKVKLGNDCLNAGSTENNTKEQIQQKEGMIDIMKTSEFWKQHEHLKTDMVESNFSLWIGKPRIVKMR